LEREDRGIPFQKTARGQRRYDLTKLSSKQILQPEKKQSTLAYARVFCDDQKEDLQRQEKMLEMFCISHGWSFEIISDLGSGSGCFRDHHCLFCSIIRVKKSEK